MLSAWQASGLSMAVFSRRHRLTAQRVAWWRDRLSKREKPARRREQSAGGLCFAPVVLRGPAAGGDGAAVTIRVRGGMAATATARLVDYLRVGHAVVTRHSLAAYRPNTLSRNSIPQVGQST